MRAEREEDEKERERQRKEKEEMFKQREQQKASTYHMIIIVRVDMCLIVFTLIRGLIEKTSKSYE